MQNHCIQANLAEMLLELKGRLWQPQKLERMLGSSKAGGTEGYGACGMAAGLKEFLAPPRLEAQKDTFPRRSNTLDALKGSADWVMRRNVQTSGIQILQ